DHVAGFTGPRTEADYLLDMEFDHIFFTGSAAVAKIISEKAARHLSRVTLELGGKSPVVIDDTVNLKIAARRIVFGKLINAGQTCIAPDYLICKSEIRDEVIKELVTALKEAYPAGFLDNLDYPKIINEKHYNRLCELIKQQKPLFGGAFRQQKIEPALILADNDSPLLHEEIFGPILPIITYNNEAEIKTIIDRNPFPLAFYLFSKNNKLKKQLLSTIRFGGCSINDTLSHFINNRLPFGGIRLSGQGSYHGFYSFRTFSHEAGIYEKHHKREIKLKYPPYSSKIKKIIRKYSCQKIIKLNKTCLFKIYPYFPLSLLPLFP
ncbi:MAG: aldehyde dehydrogenase family protein, partial [Bacilli bacterium]|nr:aldehyde dehydrogenase family protein [Bacilli bacterium]